MPKWVYKTTRHKVNGQAVKSDSIIECDEAAAALSTMSPKRKCRGLTSSSTSRAPRDGNSSSAPITVRSFSVSGKKRSRFILSAISAKKTPDMAGVFFELL